MFPVKINKKLLHCSKKQYWFQKNAKGTNVMITKTEFERWGIMLQTQVSCYTKIQETFVRIWIYYFETELFIDITYFFINPKAQAGYLLKKQMLGFLYP